MIAVYRDYTNGPYCRPLSFLDHYPFSECRVSFSPLPICISISAVYSVPGATFSALFKSGKPIAAGCTLQKGWPVHNI